MKAEEKDTSRLKVWAGVAALAMLLAISSYNVLPTLNRAVHGEIGAMGLAVVQIAFTVLLAIIPFVPGWDAKTRGLLTVAFMLVNGYFAYENAGHRHDGERTAHNQHAALLAELETKKDVLSRLGEFTATDASQVAFARTAVNAADEDKAAAKASAKAAETRFFACEKRCKAFEDEAKRLKDETERKDAEARTARKTLERLSGWRTLTKQAEPINARIDELQKKLGEEAVVSDTSSNSETQRTIEALFIAAVIELGNRFGPEGIFKFIFFAAGVPLLLAPARADADSEPETDIADMPGNVHPVSSPPARRTAKKRTPKQDTSGKVIRFPRAKPDDARALIAEGKTQRETAEILGVSDRTIRRWVQKESTRPAKSPVVSDGHCAVLKAA